MTAFKNVLESRMKIRFHDCDPFNHLNNSKYIDYIMTARGDQLIENYQLDIYKIAQESGLAWVTAQTQIAYLAPALVMEEVIISTRLMAYSEKSLHVEAQMWNEDKTVIKAVMWAKFVHYNLIKQRSHIHSEQLMQLFAQVVNPPESEFSFEERVKWIQRQAQPNSEALNVKP